MTDPAAALLSDADWLAHRYDPQHDAIHFLNVPREMRAAVPFLTDAELPLDRRSLVVARRDLGAATASGRPLQFIFHSAYCGSTVLANALDLPGKVSSLKEPMLLNDMVGWRHRGAAPDAVQAVLSHGLDLLSRPYPDEQTMIVKPSNVVNALIPAMLTLRPEAKALLLYAPLDLFVGSIARKGLWGRHWVRDLLSKQLRDGIVDLGFDGEALFLLTDLQVAAVGWLVQHRLFIDVAKRFGGRVRTLDSEAMLGQRAEMAAALAAHFDLPAETGPLIADAAAFARNSKDNRPFDQQQRRDAQAAAARLHGDEIDKVVTWARVVADSAGIDMTPPAPLLR